jgi:hypothetical protein
VSFAGSTLAPALQSLATITVSVCTYRLGKRNDATKRETDKIEREEELKRDSYQRLSTYIERLIDTNQEYREALSCQRMNSH